MKNSRPLILYLLSFLLIFWRILLILINYSAIIEWKLCFILRTTIKFELIIEWRGILYSSIVLFISRNVIKFSKAYIKNDQNNLRFTQIVLMFIASINMLIFIPNILCLLIGWDGLGITSFILVIYYNNSRSLSAGILTIITNRLGDTFLLISIIITLNTGDWLPIFYLIKNDYFIYQWLGIIVACMTKRAQIPFSTWLPAAIAAPTPVSALVHSSTLVTAGVFILWRFNTIISNSKIIQSIIILTRILTILTAGIRAIYENDIKKIIALSTLRQLGLIIIPIAINIPILRFFHISAHAIFKALLFIRAGTLISENNHTQDLRLFGKFNTLSPIASRAILISSTALIGIPFITGYYSKHRIIRWSSRIFINITIYLLLLYIILLTSVYSLRLLIFLLILPTKTSPLIIQKRFSDNNTPILLMSIIRIWAGRAFQWLSPLKETNTIIDNHIKRATPDIIILITLFLTPILTIKLRHYKPIFINKILNSIRFMVPLSSQFILPLYLNISLSFYKHLDQSWLENYFTLGPSSKLINLRSMANLLLTKSSQNTLFLSVKSRVILMTTLWVLN